MRSAEAFLAYLHYRCRRRRHHHHHHHRRRGCGYRYGYAYTSSSSSSSSSWKTLLALVMASLLILSSSPPTIEAAFDSSESDGAGSSNRVFQWQILTKRNFSSQIRLHPHLLLMVTVPWSGESRSLMKELAQLISNKQEMFGTLKLMLLFRNRDRMLADAIGATEGITILCYHHSLSYKYQGRLRAQNILSSVHFLMLLPPEQLPLKPLKTPEDLKTFLQSTDKAVILFEFCGWTHALLAKGKDNGTENAFDGPFGAGCTGETNRSLAAKGKKNKGMENEKLTCSVQNGVRGIPWLGEFSSVSDSDFLEVKNMSPTVGISCSFEEFQRFDTFFSTFMTVVREFFLPPERIRFGLVPERSLLSSLGVEDSGLWLSSLDVGDSVSWSMILNFAGCPHCLKVFREGDDLKSSLRMQNSLVVELGGGEHDPEASVPANTPSMLLFIDRTSDSSETRRKSKEAIDAFRSLALHYQTSCGIGQQNNVQTDKFVFYTHQSSKSKPGHQSLKLSPTSQDLALDKMSIMIIDEGKHVTLDKITPDLQGNSLHEILAYVLQRKTEVKLSSLAKEVGFQLLSEDIDIKIEEALPTQTKVLHSDQLLNPTEGFPEASVDLHEDQKPFMASTCAVESKEQYKPANADESSHYTEEKTTFDTSRRSSGESDHFHGNQVLGSAEDENVQQKSFSERANFGEEKLHCKGFRGSFFFSDGGSQFLKALTAGSKIPSVVIVDPILQKHYVLPEETAFSYSSLSDFLDGFLNGSLLPYQRSESVVPSPRESPCPPFVNMDFHEVDSIPQVATNTFSEFVIGFNQTDIANAGHAWKKDVLVLFTNSWCGFCQRMELVVREVYRAFKHYTTMLKNGPKSVLADDVKDTSLKLPLIYFMDCTVNECSLILRSVAQRELYPSLLLFPAERKDAVPYEGSVAVSDIIKFLVDHGHNADNLVKENGILQTGVEQENRKQYFYEDTSQIAIHKEVLLKYRTPERVVRYNQIIPQKSNGLPLSATQVVVGSLLIATDKLLNVQPFDKSAILIIKADQGTGFQGLIINKHISWDSLHELDEGFEMLREARLSFGGPLVKQGIPLVALTRRAIKDQHPEILPNVYFLDQWATVHEVEGLKMRNDSVNDYWFFLGYSNWGWDQLFDEIAQGAWKISSNDMEQLDWPWR